MVWTPFAANAPRFVGTPRALLIEGQRTNLNTNPRAEGAVAGTPGTRPTGWPTIPSGVSTEIVGTVTVGGVPGLLVRFFGVPSTTTGQQFTIGGAPDVVVAGTVVSNSAFVRLHSGSLVNINAGVFNFRAGSSETGLDFTPSATLQRVTNTRTLVSTSSGTMLRWNYVDTVTAVDFTLFVGWPQREHAAFASSPILPAVGTPAASTRGADLVSATLASLGIGDNGACTVLGTIMIPQNAPATASQILFQIDDGSESNRYQVRNSAGGAFVLASRTIGGASSDASGFAVTAGTVFRFGASIDGDGRIAASVSGAAALAVAGGATSGLATLRIGSNASGVANLHGEVGSLRVLPYALSDAALAARVAALPLP